MRAQLRLLHQEDTLPFSLPEQAGLLGAPRAGCQTLIMAPRLSVQSPTWQLAITKESSPRSRVMGAVSRLAAGRLSTRLLPAARPGHLTAALGRALRSYFGVTPTRKAAESQPCWARCCARRGMTVPCPKETRSLKKEMEVAGGRLSPPGQDRCWGRATRCWDRRRSFGEAAGRGWERSPCVILMGWHCSSRR